MREREKASDELNGERLLSERAATPITAGI
jgi:hypothetical protein